MLRFEERNVKFNLKSDLKKVAPIRPQCISAHHSSIILIPNLKINENVLKFTSTNAVQYSKSAYLCSLIFTVRFFLSVFVNKFCLRIRWMDIITSILLCLRFVIQKYVQRFSVVSNCVIQTFLQTKIVYSGEEPF